MQLVADAHELNDCPARVPRRWGEKERRRGLRIRQTRPVKVYEPIVARYFAGQTADLSTTGLRIELPLSVAARPGKVLQIHVGLSETGEALAHFRQMLPARVIWVDRVSGRQEGRMVLGVELMSSIGVMMGAA